MIAKSGKELKAILESFGNLIAFDTETREEVPFGKKSLKKGALVLSRATMIVFSAAGETIDGEIVSVSAFCEEDYGSTVGIPRREIIACVRPFLEDASKKKICHNANYDCFVMRNHGIIVNNVDCTVILSRCRDENINAGLKDLAPYVGMMLSKTRNIAFSDVAQMSLYAEEDAIATYKLWHLFNEDSYYLQENRFIYQDLEVPAMLMLQDMEGHGMYVDVDYFRSLEKPMRERMRNLEHGIYVQAGQTFNVNSPKQLGDILYKKLGLVAPKKNVKSKTDAPSTNEQALVDLLGTHKIIELLMEYRKLIKLHGTYVNEESGIPAYADSKGFIHATFNQAGTQTSRMSCSFPNLQQVPARSDYGAMIRKGFKAPKGYKIIVNDYSMFELILMANFCRDPLMVKVLSSIDGDLHQTTATMLGVSRSVGKNINFGLLYGMGPDKLVIYLKMRGIVISKQEAQKYIKGFFSTYLGISLHKENLLKFAREKGYIKYISGRVRRVPDLDSSSKAISASAERKVINSEIQGSAADWCKYAMCRIHNDPIMKSLGYRIAAQVHDEIIGYVPDKRLSDVKRAVIRKKKLMMESPSNPIFPVIVPIKVGGGAGDNWKDAK